MYKMNDTVLSLNDTSIKNSTNSLDSFMTGMGMQKGKNSTDKIKNVLTMSSAEKKELEGCEYEGYYSKIVTI